jgi:hypothetical protein
VRNLLFAGSAIQAKESRFLTPAAFGMIGL